MEWISSGLNKNPNTGLIQSYLYRIWDQLINNLKISELDELNTTVSVENPKFKNTSKEDIIDFKLQILGEKLKLETEIIDLENEKSLIRKKIVQ